MKSRSKTMFMLRHVATAPYKSNFRTARDLYKRWTKDETILIRGNVIVY